MALSKSATVKIEELTNIIHVAGCLAGLGLGGGGSFSAGEEGCAGGRIHKM